MALEIKARVPGAVTAGEPFEVKALALAPPLADPADGFDAAGLPIPHYVGFEAWLDQRLAWRVELGPGVARNIISISGATGANPFAISLRSLQREIVRNDPAWRGGHYEPGRGPRQAFCGFALASASSSCRRQPAPCAARPTKLDRAAFSAGESRNASR